MRGKSVVPVLILVLSLILGSPMLNAASLQVLYTFIGADGGAPDSGVILGPDGALYGVTAFGGDYDNGTVFRLSQAQGGVCSARLLVASLLTTKAISTARLTMAATTIVGTFSN